MSTNTIERSLNIVKPTCFPQMFNFRRGVKADTLVIVTLSPTSLHQPHRHDLEDINPHRVALSVNCDDVEDEFPANTARSGTLFVGN